MPVYEYQCKACGHAFEEWQKITDAPGQDVPQVRPGGGRTADQPDRVHAQGRRLVQGPLLERQAQGRGQASGSDSSAKAGQGRQRQGGGDKGGGGQGRRVDKGGGPKAEGKSSGSRAAGGGRQLGSRQSAGLGGGGSGGARRRLQRQLRRQQVQRRGIRLRQTATGAPAPGYQRSSSLRGGRFGQGETHESQTTLRPDSHQARGGGDRRPPVGCSSPTPPRKSPSRAWWSRWATARSRRTDCCASWR